MLKTKFLTIQRNDKKKVRNHFKNMSNLSIKKLINMFNFGQI